MLVRRLIVALLSVLLLAGGSTVGTSASQSGHPDSKTTAAVSCGGPIHEGAAEGGSVSVDCEAPEQSHCRIHASQCSPAFAYAIVAGALWVPERKPGQACALPARTGYQNPIPEVLTPPPDSLS